MFKNTEELAILGQIPIQG